MSLKRIRRRLSQAFRPGEGSLTDLAEHITPEEEADLSKRERLTGEWRERGYVRGREGDRLGRERGLKGWREGGLEGGIEGGRKGVKEWRYREREIKEK